MERLFFYSLTHNNSPCNAAAWLRAFLCLINPILLTSQCKIRLPRGWHPGLKAQTQQKRTSKTCIFTIRAVVEKFANKSADPGPSSVARMSQLAFADFFTKCFRIFTEIFPKFLENLFAHLKLLELGL